MEDSGSKLPRGSTPRVREGSANRAKNHTVILDSNLTGGVRARLGGEFQGGRVGGLEASAQADEADWETPRVSSDVGVRKAPPAFASEVGEPSDHEGVAIQAGYAQGEPVELPEPGVLEGVQHGLEVAEVEERPSSWDPLGLFAAQGEVAAEQFGTAESAPFAPDPTPEFVHVTEEPMLTEAALGLEEVHWKSCTPLVGFLVSFDYEPAGSYLELRTGRLIVSAQPDLASNCLVLSHESVSPSHAVMRVAAGGSIQVLDQLSESGTRIRKFDTGEEILLSGEKAVLSHGDIVSFGDRNFHVCLVMGNSSQG